MIMLLHFQEFPVPIDSIIDLIDCKFIKFLPIHDERGYFYESLNDEIFDLVKFFPKQESISKSIKSVVRGLHMQNSPPVSKLVRVLTGEINDVVVDCRPDSSTFGRHAKIKLSSDIPGWLFVPGGYSHGFEVLSDHAVVNYLVSEKYNPDYESTFYVLDPNLGIDWETPKDKMVMSKKDRFAKTLREVLK